MIRREFLSSVLEFVARADEVPELVAVILFGSVARGDADRRSDIDLCLIFDTRGDPEHGEGMRIARELVRELEAKHGVRISLVAERLRSADPGFLENLCAEGVVVWGRPLVVDARRLRLKRYAIVSYDLSALSNSEKTRFHRALHGYRVVREVRGKRYVSENEGLLRRVRGCAIGRGVVLLPARHLRHLISSSDPKIKYRVLEVWTTGIEEVE